MSWRVIEGDALVRLREMEPCSVQTVVTSPPYWGLRDYGSPGQLGLEPSPEEYVAKLVEVFQEVRRVLRDDGTVWLNLGDSYAAQRGGTSMPAETLAGGEGGRMPDGSRVNRDRHDGYSPTRNASNIGLKHKDLVGIPWRVAFALQADGWYLRSDIIWSKPNPMPESVTDRPTKSHEYVFLLTKSARYYFDADAVRAPNSEGTLNGHSGRAIRPNPPSLSTIPPGHPTEAHPDKHHNGLANGATEWNTNGRNIRTVWSIATEPFPGAHFATFPKKLVEPCVKAGSAPGDLVCDPFCGSGTVGVVALRLGRSFLGIELSPTYAEMARERIRWDSPLFNMEVEA